MDVPDVRYTRSGGVAIAYQVVGDGTDLVFSPHISDLYTLWITPHNRRFLDRLTTEVRLIVFNPRGTGLSDRPRNLTVEARVDDLVAVLDATGCTRPSLLGIGQTSSNAQALFAATYPERCARLVLVRPSPRFVRSASYPYGGTEEYWLAHIAEVRDKWGDRAFLEAFALGHEPAFAGDEEAIEGLVWQYRLGASPAGASDFLRLAMETDITDVLGSIRVPTLVIYRDDEHDVADYVVKRLRDVQALEFPGLSRSIYSEEMAEAILDFVSGSAPHVIPDTVLATVVFTDLVGSTERAAELGDRAWRELLAEHHRRVRQELTRYRGVEVDTAGDGFFCRFDGPARAIGCTQQIVEDARDAGLEVRAGIHTGECEVIGDKIAGLAVNVGSRIAAAAAPGEVLVSQTVTDLVAGSGIEFEERGEHELKGVPGTWRLYAVRDA
jgi:class 3 adenylate cyclase